ncbi:MAG: hypothetical protein EA442_01485 [Candidatus Nitrosopelagicus sp.]|nr:MAG: hypothetical protein EA442_01485 [Candidatus Nitrosopelagicus sp.]
MDTGFFKERKTAFNPIEANVGDETIRYPPNSSPPTVFSGIIEIRERFNKRNASLMPNLEDFNQMFRQYADGLLNANESVFPPGHPLYNREKSFTLMKEANDKLLKENLELKKQLEKSEKSSSQPNF